MATDSSEGPSTLRYFDRTLTQTFVLLLYQWERIASAGPVDSLYYWASVSEPHTCDFNAEEAGHAS